MKPSPRTGAAVAAVIVAAVLTALPLLPGIAAADELDELRGQLRAVTARAESLDRRAWNQDAEKSLTEKAERAVDLFHRLAGSGTMDSPTAHLTLSTVEQVRERYTGVIQRMQDDVIKVDGDLEAAQDSAAWKQREVLAQRLLYRLNWIRYELAMRYESRGQQRTRLLQRAERGFADFLGAGDRAVVLECLYGHGLALKAMKRYDEALDDLNAALDMSPAAGRATDIRAAVADIALATGQIETALRQTASLLAGAGKKEDRLRAAFLRAKALLLGLGKYRDRYDDRSRASMRLEAARMLERLHASPGYWRSKASQLVDAGVEDPLEWTAAGTGGFVTLLIADSLRRRGDCPRARPLYDALFERSEYLSEARLGRGFCLFHSGKWEDSITELGQALEGAGPVALEQAAWFRFKAAESLYLSADEQARDAAALRYSKLAREFVDAAPGHENAWEAWFRLGEWHRDHRQYLDCADAFARVRGDAAFMLKSRFQSSQCAFQSITDRDPGDDPDTDELANALASLDGFLSHSTDFRKRTSAGRGTAGLLDPLEARATVMAAALAGRLEVANESLKPSAVDRLAGFEQQFPEQADLLPEVLVLRAYSFRRLKDPAQAARAVSRLAGLEGNEGNEQLRKLGVLFLKDAASISQDGDEDLARSYRKIALSAWEGLLAHTDPGDPRAADIRRLVGDLRAQTSS